MTRGEMLFRIYKRNLKTDTWGWRDLEDYKHLFWEELEDYERKSWEATARETDFEPNDNHLKEFGRPA